MPTGGEATRAGVSARGAGQRQGGPGKGVPFLRGPLCPSLLLAQGSVYSGRLCALRNWGKAAGAQAGTLREHDPICPALHAVGSGLFTSGWVVFRLQWASDHRWDGQRGGFFRRQSPRAAPQRY